MIPTILASYEWNRYFIQWTWVLKLQKEEPSFSCFCFRWSLKRSPSTSHRVHYCSNLDQFTLWQGNNVSKAENAALQTTVSLPTAYDGTFSRALALAGVNFHISNTVQFQMFLEPYTSPTINTVTVVSGTNTFFYELSVFVVLTKSSSTWVWIYNSSKKWITQPSHVRFFMTSALHPRSRPQ